VIWRIGTITLAGLASGWLGFMAADREPATIVHKIWADPTAAAPGQTIRFNYDAHRQRSCATHVDRFVFTNDGIRHVVPELSFPHNVLPVGPDHYTVPVIIPENAVAGPAVYRTVNCYRCNLLHNVFPICETREIRFTVQPR
jgi:hypothetical protein